MLRGNARLGLDGIQKKSTVVNQRSDTSKLRGAVTFSEVWS